MEWTFEQSKKQLAIYEKAKNEAETTVNVLAKQMEGLKTRRKQYEEACLKDRGVKIDEVPAQLEAWRKTYVEKTQEVATLYESLTGEADGKSD